jgi:hypothetical protein
VAAWMFYNFLVLKNHRIAKNSTTTKASEKISIDFEFLELTNGQLKIAQRTLRA